MSPALLVPGYGQRGVAFALRLRTGAFRGVRDGAGEASAAECGADGRRDDEDLPFLCR